MEDTQTPVQATPSLAPFGLNMVGFDAIKFGHPFGAHLSGSGSLSPNLVTAKSCSDADIGSSFPSGSGCGHSSGPESSTSAPRPSWVPFSSGVDSSCITLLVVDVNAPSGDHGRDSIGFPPGKSSVDD
jgi:hypothetical protein